MRRFFLRVPFLRHLIRTRAKYETDGDPAMLPDAIRAHDYAMHATREVSPRWREVRAEGVPGERRTANGWAWREPRLKMAWVLGLYYASRIQVGVAPGGGDWSVPTLEHEAGHHALFSRGIWTHDPRFDHAFKGWAETRAMGFPWLAGISTIKLEHKFIEVPLHDADGNIVGVADVVNDEEDRRIVAEGRGDAAFGLV